MPPSVRSLDRSFLDCGNKVLTSKQASFESSRLCSFNKHRFPSLVAVKPHQGCRTPALRLAGPANRNLHKRAGQREDGAGSSQTNPGPIHHLAATSMEKF